MALFGKKSASNGAEDESAAASTKRTSKKASGMSQILHESVLETALDEFKKNDEFIHYEHGEPKYVGLILDTADIGGLDKKSRKDEAKGSIIECINSGRIQTYLNADLMDAECICIIPDAGTLTAMDEFSLLTEAPYEFCLVDSTGDIELLGVKTTFSQVSDLVAEDRHIDDILGDADDDSSDDEEDEDDDFYNEGQSESAGSTTYGSAPSTGIPVEDDIPEEDEIGGPVGNGMSDVDAWTAGNDEVDEPVDETGDSGDEYDPYAAAMSGDDMPEQTIPEDFSSEVVVRKFYSKDLGLEVTSEPFDAQFMQSNPYIPFDEHRGPGWINDQLNEMSRAANVKLARRHHENQWQMRERYFMLVSLQCDRIREQMDIEDPDTQYGQMYLGIQNERRAALDGIDRRVMKRKEEIEGRWRQRLQEIGMEAARAAQHQYRERYGQQHDMEIFGIEAAEKAAIEDEYQDSLRELNERRRIEATSLLDISITEILNELSDMYVTMLRDEQQLYAELDQEMRDFVDANRQDDIARSAVLAQELRQQERADKVLAEQTAKMQALSREYNLKREELLADMEQMKRDNAARVAALRGDNERDKARAAQEKADAEARYDELLDKYQKLDATKNKEYDARITEMRDQNDALQDRCDNLMEVHRRSNLVSSFLIIAIAIAMLAIGFIGGEYVNTQRRTRLEQQQILDEFHAVEDARAVAQTNDASSQTAEQPVAADVKEKVDDKKNTVDESEDSEESAEEESTEDAEGVEGEAADNEN